MKRLDSSKLAVGLAMMCFAASSAQAKETALPVDSATNLQLVDSIPTSLLWHSRDAQTHDADGAFTLAVWPIDAESQPVREGRRLVAVVMVGKGDLRETPVAMEVWSDVDRVIRPIEVDGDKPSIRLQLEPRGCPDKKACELASSSLLVMVGADGAVRINDRNAGSIR